MPSQWLWPTLERALSSHSVEAEVVGALHRSSRARSCLRARSVAYLALGANDAEADRLAEYPHLRSCVEKWVEITGGPGAALLVTFADEVRMLPIAPSEVAAYLEALDGALLVAFGDLGNLAARPNVMNAVLLLAQAHATTEVVRTRIEAIESRAIRSIGRDPEFVRALLTSSEHAAVAAAVSYLGDARPFGKPTLSAEQSRDLTSRFVLIARGLATKFPSSEIFGGFDGVGSVRIVNECVDPDFVVERHGAEIHVASVATMANLLERFGEHRGTQIACLYFAHEAIHLVQGLARKTTVTEIRKHGSEGVVLRLDLEADLLAIRAVAHAMSGSWTSGELLDRTIEGLEAFPATLSHTAVSAERKSIRFASLLFHKCVGCLDNGYVVLDLPPDSGSAFLVRVHDFERVERSFAVRPDDVRWLRNLAHEAAGNPELGEIEARCARLLSGAVRGGDGPVRPRASPAPSR